VATNERDRKQVANGLTRIWRRGASTVGEVQAGLAQASEAGAGRELAYTTVQTVLNTLHRKGKLMRQMDGRAFVYSAVETEARALRHAVRDLVDRMFGGSSEELVMSLVKSREVDLERVKAMTHALDPGSELKLHSQLDVESTREKADAAASANAGGTSGAGEGGSR
jgi:BlaI family penicillinase repressor